jgi:hypothetical protein
VLIQLCQLISSAIPVKHVPILYDIYKMKYSQCAAIIIIHMYYIIIIHMYYIIIIHMYYIIIVHMYYIIIIHMYYIIIHMYYIIIIHNTCV